MPKPAASWSATKTSASSTAPSPDAQLMMLMSWPFEGRHFKEDVRLLLLVGATSVGLESFDRAGLAAGKQDEREKNGVLRVLIRGSVGHDDRTVLFMS